MSIKMKHIILDTNILMAIDQFHLDVLSQLKQLCDFPYDVCVLDKTMEELEKIKKEQRGRDKKAAVFALHFIKRFPIPTMSSKEEGTVDDILAASSKEGYIIVTQDKELKKRLTKPFITLRKKDHLILQ